MRTRLPYSLLPRLWPGPRKLSDGVTANAVVDVRSSQPGGIKRDSDASAAASARRSDAFLVGTLLVLWIVGGAIALSLNHTRLFTGFDGGFIRNVAQRQFDWHVPLFTASIDFFQGLGDIFFGVNFRLFPAFVAASSLGSGMLAKVAAYGCVLAELSVACMMFCRSLGVSRPLSLAATLLTCLGLLPFHGYAAIWHIAAVAPHVVTVIAAALAMAAAFMYCGRGGWRADCLYALLMLALLVWLVLAGSIVLILAGPFLLLCGICGLLAAATPYERWCKIGLGLAAAAMLVATGPALYVGGLLIETAAATFPVELANDRATFVFTSMLFHWNINGPAGTFLVLMAIAGAVVTIWERRLPTLRIFAIALVAYVAGWLSFSMFTMVFDVWRGPSPLYFEFFIVPLYAVFAVVLVARVFERVQQGRGWQPWSAARLDVGVVTAGIVLAFALTAATPAFVDSFQYPAPATALTRLLADETGLQPGSQFRGRTLNVTGRSLHPNVTWFELHGNDMRISREIGNEMRVVGLHRFGIPSLFQYGPTISPAFYATTTRLLGRPGDVQMRNVTVVREIEPKILAMLGVRFVITDTPFDGPATLRASLPVKDGSFYLYEIADPNIGNYSPTVVRSLPSASDIIERLRSPDFDAAREVIGDVTVPAGGLTPARNARITFDGASLRVQADSSGHSILLLPLEFSRCLAATPGQSGDVVLFRANLLETGLLFSGRLDTSISARTGPFLNPGCRLRDYSDMKSLRIGELPPR
jgi:hypothetical protein